MRDAARSRLVDARIWIEAGVFAAASGVRVHADRQGADLARPMLADRNFALACFLMVNGVLMLAGWRCAAAARISTAIPCFSGDKTAPRGVGTLISMLAADGWSKGRPQLMVRSAWA